MAILILTLLVVVLDQLAKLAIKSRFYLNESHDVLGNVLRFTYIQNPGIAFGLRFGNKFFFTVVAVIASVAILIYLYRLRHARFAFRLALALILGGAIGNLIDRFAYGEVIDFIDLGIGNMRWPYVFNLADVGVTVGMSILMALALFGKDEQEQPPA